ncbi:MAG: hypothetical protein KTR16_11490 [Acidiferrobacterales bacterium]|nr:hypothetical protein [Acidiferrobacterales bacterium]
MNCEKCGIRQQWMWRPKSGFLCGSCLIPTIDHKTDTDSIAMIREAYPDQFTTRTPENIVNEALDKCINQAK